MMKSKHLFWTTLSFVIILFLSIVILISSPSPLAAKVTGVCSNCHTMHNSQDGSEVARTGSGTGWNGSGQLTGGSTAAGAQMNTLVTDCVGCHTSTTNLSTINLGGSTIPIVYNTTQPVQPLAGGNFYWVAQGDDSKGHNVYGIADVDATLGEAPGFTSGACGSGSRCHISLAQAPVPSNFNRGGCQGCHVFTYHHEDNGVYRFLKGHGANIGSSLSEARKDITNYPDYVQGVEDSDWEKTTSAVDHNYYNGTTTVYSSDGNGLTNQQTLTSFCSGCHGDFHGPQSGNDGMGSDTPWIRHPTDVDLPETGEYAGYNPVTNYSTEAPVAWVNPSSPDRTEAIVMCLTCHKPHGSDQPDMLRWDYGDMVVGSGNSGGCFTCHSDKN
jgi:predicted CXXCH cytochrome family protein